MQGQNGLRVELDRGHRQRLVCQAHDHAIFGLGGDFQTVGQCVGFNVEAVVAAGSKWRGYALKDAFARVSHEGVLSVHRNIHNAKLRAKVLSYPLMAQTDTEHRKTTIQSRPNQRQNAHLFRCTWPRRDEHELWLDAVQPVQVEAGTERDDLCTALANIIGQRVDEAVLIVHKKDSHLPGCPAAGRRGSDLGLVSFAGDCVEECRSLDVRLLLFFVWFRVEQQRSTRANRGNTILEVNGANCDARVELPVEGKESDATAIPTPWAVFEILNRLHSGRLGRTGERARPHVREKSIEHVAMIVKGTFDVVNRMEQPRVRLDQSPADKLDRTWDADT